MTPKTLVSGTILTVVTSRPDSSLWSNAAVSSALPYYVFSLSFNIVVTALIIIRLVHHHNTVRAALGSKHAQPYASLAAFIVESAAPYSVLSLLYLILFAVNNPAQQIFTGILSGAQVCNSSLLTNLSLKVPYATDNRKLSYYFTCRPRECLGLQDVNNCIFCSTR